MSGATNGRQPTVAYQNVVRRELLTTCCGQAVRWGKVRSGLEVCFRCPRNEPAAPVQGARGGWYHLHPAPAKPSACPLGCGARQRPLYADFDECDWDELDAMFDQ